MQIQPKTTTSTEHMIFHVQLETPNISSSNKTNT